MNDRELMQRVLFNLEHTLPFIEDFGNKEDVSRQHKLIADLYARLAQPEPATLNSLDCACGASWTFENGALRYEPKVEQEPVATLFGSLPVYDTPTQPVAWKHNYIDDVVIGHRPADIDRYPDRWTALYKDPTPCQTCEALARTVMMDQTSHDTAPPRKEWQSLTDDEVQEFLDNRAMSEWCGAGHVHLMPYTFARAIEAKLREKNGL